jgi:hypothetical protein
MKKTAIFCLLIVFISCKYDRDKLDDNKSTFSDKDSTSITSSNNEFNQTNFKDRAEELIYIREYLKYKLPQIIIEKDPDLIKTLQYELIAEGENPSLTDVALRTRKYKFEYDRSMSNIINRKYNFKKVKELLESKGEIEFKTSETSRIYYNNYNQESTNYDDEKDNKKSQDDDVLNSIKSESKVSDKENADVIDNNFDNRKIIYKPSPKYICNEQGKVIVSILVNRNGECIEANAGVTGTTNNAKCLLDEAKIAAMNTKWEPNDKAPINQSGKIVYNFNLN